MASEVLKLCMSKGFLLDKEMLDVFSSLSDKGARNLIGVMGDLGIVERVIDKKVFEKYFDKIRKLMRDFLNKEETLSFFNNLGYSEEEIYGESVKEFSEDLQPLGKIRILSAPAFPQRKVEVKDFVGHFKARYESMRSILEGFELENLTSIRKIGIDKKSCTIIAMIVDKRVTKNKNLFIEVEDLTGRTNILVNYNKKDLFKKAKNVLLDDVVAFNVSGTKELLFMNDIIFPEARIEEKRYGKTDEYIAFISDVHVGSKNFLEKNLLRFVKWLNGGEGNSTQKEIAGKVKYLFVNGDNVDGVSVYPGQERELEIPNLRGQYKKMAEILKLIRKDIKIIISPGQHDCVWIGEPQPIIGEGWAPDFYKMENVTLTPNPALVEIDDEFKILTYHGASITHFIEEIPEIRMGYGHKSPSRVVREILKRRHLAPTHGLMDYIPCEKGDPLVLDQIPDIITTGDQHRSEVREYNNILIVTSSCWQSITSFEEKVGNIPDPCKVPIFNLKTREIKILDFSGDSDEIMEEEKKDV